jgi:Bacterial Ig-like domain (group 1)
MRSQLFLAASPMLVVVAACGSDSSGPKIGPASQVTVATSPTTSGIVRTSLGSFAVKVADANGNGVAGNVVNFNASGGGGVNFAPSSAISDESGIATTTVTLGTKTGTTQLVANATGVSAAASVTVTATAGPLVSLVTTPKFMRFFSIGDTARITYALQDEFANAVTAAALSFAVGDPTLVSVDPQGLVRVLRNGGITTITASAGGRSDTVGVNVLAFGASVCTGIATPSTMAVGSVVTVQGANACLTGAAGAPSEYTIVAYNSSPDGAAILSTNAFASGVAAPPSSQLVPSSAGPLLARSPSRVASAPTKELDQAFHQRLLSSTRSLKRLFGAARSTRDARLSASRTASGRLSPSSPSFSSIPSTAAVGDIVRLNVASASCSDAIIRGFRVTAVGAKVVVLADTLNPANGFSDSDYVKFATRFDTLVYPLDVDNFGAPSDFDGNGKVAVLFTKYVNELTPANSGSFVGGFFHPRDLFPRATTPDLQGCPTSNEGEMFYMLVPDPTGAVNGNKHTLGFVDTLTIGVLAHEFQHLINAGRRIYVNTGAQDFEETWLNEGLSHIAEELLYYRESGLQPRSGLDAALIAPKFAIWRADAASNFARLLDYIEDPGASSPIDAVNDELSTRGAAWSFLRYSVDRAFTSDAGVWSRFTNSIQTGLNTVADGLLTDPRPYVADFTLANYISHLGISTDPRFQHKSWNYRDIFSKNFGSRATGVFVPIGFYPIKLTGLADGVAQSTGVRGGSASYFRVGVPAGKEALVTFSSAQGAPNASFVFYAVRTK